MNQAVFLVHHSHPFQVTQLDFQVTLGKLCHLKIQLCHLKNPQTACLSSDTVCF